jgi:hypothetical protein
MENFTYTSAFKSLDTIEVLLIRGIEVGVRLIIDLINSENSSQKNNQPI